MSWLLVVYNLSLLHALTERHDRLQALSPFQVDGAAMKKAKPTAIFMNCLPAVRGEEQTAEVLDGPQSVIYDQAENRFFICLHRMCSLCLYRRCSLVSYLRPDGEEAADSQKSCTATLQFFICLHRMCSQSVSTEGVLSKVLYSDSTSKYTWALILESFCEQAARSKGASHLARQRL
jgi:hypothetical protein